MKDFHQLKTVLLCTGLVFMINTTKADEKQIPSTDSLQSTCINSEDLNFSDESKKEKRSENDSSTGKPKKSVNIVWLPVIASTPANGWMFGIAPAANWTSGDPSTTSISTLLSSLIWTTLKQFLFTCKGTIFFPNDKFQIMQDLRYFVTSQPTYGLGTGPQSYKLSNTGVEYADGLFSKGTDSVQLMKFNYFRLYETFFKRINTSRMFVGLGYHLDIHSKITDKLLNLDTSGGKQPVLTSDYLYSKLYGFNPNKYTLSGLSANFLFDSRDNTINPYDGWYGLFQFKYNPKWLGSTLNSTSIWAEFRDYFHLSSKRERNILALWAYGNFQTSGHVPYLDLPALGWDQYGRSGRAYPQGRFRGEKVIYTEAEWRFPLQREKEKWGAVLFVNATTASNDNANVPVFKYVNPGYGLGLRYMLSEKSRTNLCIDYGFGSYGAKGFYLSVNEVF